jgi:hypothetical protein
MKQLTSIFLLIFFTKFSVFGQDNRLSEKLQKLFAKTVKIYPSDSLSLYNFYFKWFPSRNSKEMQNQISRLEGLISKRTIDRCQKVERNLKPLMVSIIDAKSVSLAQSEMFTTLYSDFDYFSGQALLSQLVKDIENNNLVWKSLSKIAQASGKDTSYMTCMIKLSDNIRTNAEISEGIQDLVIQAIRNNPNGFLDMFIARNKEERNHFAGYIFYYENPDEELVKIYKEISINSTQVYRSAAKELLQIVENQNKNH